MDKTIYLVRHCKAFGQEPEAGLTEQGQQQAQQLGVQFAAQPINRLVSSPYARARASAAPLAQRKGLAVETDDRLVERVLSGTSMPDWRERLARSFADLDLCLPGGESSRQAMARAAAALDAILLHEATTTVVVTHGNLLTLLLRHFDESVGFAEWQRMSIPDVYCVTYSGTRSGVRRWSGGMASAV